VIRDGECLNPVMMIGRSLPVQEFRANGAFFDHEALIIASNS